MKKNKGMSIVEIIISIAIISIVLILLFSILVQIRSEDQNNQIQSNFIVNQATFIKGIEEDIVNYGVESVGNCTPTDANITNSLVSGFEDAYKCVKITYAANYLEDNIGFLLIYNYYTKYENVGGKQQGSEPAWMIQYVRGSYTTYYNGAPKKSSWRNATSLMREIPNEIDLTESPYINYTAMSANNMNAASLVLPVVTLEGEHYDINLSFTFKGNQTFKCTDQNNKFDCYCQGPCSLCQNTLANKTIADYTDECRK